MMGIGGGVFIVPLLTLVYDLTSQQAVGTSLATIVFTSLASTVAYSRQRRIDYKIGLLLMITTVPGSSLGAYLTTIVSNQLLGAIFGFFLIALSIQMIIKPKPVASESSQSMATKNKPTVWHRRIVDSYGTIFEYKANIALGFALGFFGGLSSGFLGIGGGAVLVPIMFYLVNIPMHICVATSMFIMIFTSISGVATHLSLGNVKLDYAIPLILGVVFGAQLGAYLARRTSGENLKKIFGTVLLLVGVTMILKFLNLLP
jgi:uncharacterized membrane protein YfcA